MTDATVKLTPLGVNMQVTQDPWQRRGPTDGWKPFYRLLRTDEGSSRWTTFDTDRWNKIIGASRNTHLGHSVGRMAVLRR